MEVIRRSGDCRLLFYTKLKIKKIMWLSGDIKGQRSNLSCFKYKNNIRVCKNIIGIVDELLVLLIISSMDKRHFSPVRDIKVSQFMEKGHLLLGGIALSDSIASLVLFYIYEIIL